MTSERVSVSIMRLFYSALLLGIAAFLGAIACAFAHKWLATGLLAAAFVAYCLVAPRLVTRIPQETIQKQSRFAEQLMIAMGRAGSGGWNSGGKRDDS
jgi:uncharacterized membrane protein